MKKPTSRMHSKGQTTSVVADYRGIAEGDVDPSLNKKIETLIIQDVGFIVYLDDDGYVEWSTNPHYAPFADDFGIVMNRVGYLESLAEPLVTSRRISRTLAR